MIGELDVQTTVFGDVSAKGHGIMVFFLKYVFLKCSVLCGGNLLLGVNSENRIRAIHGCHGFADLLFVALFTLY